MHVSRCRPTCQGQSNQGKYGHEKEDSKHAVPLSLVPVLDRYAQPPTSDCAIDGQSGEPRKMSGSTR
jgi:hypothetical protein